MSDHTIPLKRCAKCRNEYPATREFFFWRGVKRNGLSSYCKTCVAQHKRDRSRLNGVQPQKFLPEAGTPTACTQCGKIFPWERGNFKAAVRGKIKQPCLECDRAKRRADRLRNPERFRAKDKRYVEKHGDAVRARERDWRYQNREYIRECSRQYRQNNPHVIKIANQKSRARRAALPSNFTVDDWRRCLDYWNHRCAVCKRPQGLWHKLAQDHWIPVVKGGAYVPGNIIPLCHGEGGCNNHKRDRDAREWLIGKLGRKQAEVKLKEIQAYFDSVN